MAGRAATDDEVLDAARRILETRRFVQTQRQLGRLVVEQLGGRGVTPGRARRLVAAAPFCRVEYHSREGPAEKVLHSCPICRGRLDRVKNQTLFGGEVTLTLRCPSCGYRTGKRKRVPTLYIFHWRA